MRVLFIEPPPTISWKPQDRLRSSSRLHPSFTVTGEMVYSYSNLYAAQILRDDGHDVYYKHCQTEEITYKDLIKYIKKLDPGLVIIMSQHITLPVEKAIASEVKKLNAKMCFVGPFSSAFQPDIFKMTDVDIVCNSEYDLTVKNLVNALEGKKDLSTVRGITYRKNKKLKTTRPQPLIMDFKNIPFPAYDLIDLSKIKESVNFRSPVACAITERGCPFQCTFCTSGVCLSKTFRPYTPERVIKEARLLHDKFGIREIRYDDMTFEVDKKRVFKICKLFKKENMDLIWTNQCRTDLMTKGLAEAMASAGCKRILFGIESSDDHILKMIKKGETTQQMKAGVKRVKDAGIYVHNCVILGFPWDTMKTMKKTYDFVCKLNSEVIQFTNLTPLPGTSLYNFCLKNNLIKKPIWEGQSFHVASADTFHVSNEKVGEFSKQCYVNYYKRKEYVGMMTKRMLSSRENLKQGLKFLKAFGIRKLEKWS